MSYMKKMKYGFDAPSDGMRAAAGYVERPEDSEAEAAGLQAAYEQGLRGLRRNWGHNLGQRFERRMVDAYDRGKREKVRRALAAMKGEAAGIEVPE